MSYLADTNAVIALLKNQPPLVRRRFREASSAGAEITVSAVLFELWNGVARSARRRENAERLRVFLAGSIAVLPFEEEDAAIAGDVRAALEAEGQPIGPYDLLIAAQALRTGSALVTAKIAEFARVPGLDWRDWSATGE